MVIASLLVYTYRFNNMRGNYRANPRTPGGSEEEVDRYDLERNEAHSNPHTEEPQHTNTRNPGSSEEEVDRYDLERSEAHANPHTEEPQHTNTRTPGSSEVYLNNLDCIKPAQPSLCQYRP